MSNVPGRDQLRQPYSAMPLAELVDRLEAIGAYHQADPEVRLPFCRVCGHPWPCLTNKMASGNYLLEDGSE